jgi:hypothetical protein
MTFQLRVFSCQEQVLYIDIVNVCMWSYRIVVNTMYRDNATNRFY